MKAILVTTYCMPPLAHIQSPSFALYFILPQYTNHSRSPPLSSDSLSLTRPPLSPVDLTEEPTPCRARRQGQAGASPAAAAGPGLLR